MSFYAVKEGVMPGIYDTWEECERQIKGYPNARYKKFAFKDDAEEFVYGKKIEKASSEQVSASKIKQKVEELSADTLYAYVDGSYNDSTNIAGYGLVLVQNDQVVFKDLGSFRTMEKSLESRNVFGEIRGALKAVELALANDFKEITIVYDYKGIECWATNEWKANKELTMDYKDFMQRYMRKIDISFKKVKAHSGEDKYNDMADRLAKKATELK